MARNGEGAVILQMLTQEARAASTYRTLERGFSGWCKYADEQHAPRMPPQQATLLRYIGSLVITRANLGALSAAMGGVSFAAKICGQEMPQCSQIAVLMQAARRRFAHAVKKAAVLKLHHVRQLIEALFASGVETDARLGLTLGLTVYAGARWGDADECIFEEMIIVPGKGLRVSPMQRKNAQPGQQTKAVKELYVASGAFVSLVKQARKTFGWYTGEITGCCYSTFVDRLRKSLVRHCDFSEKQAGRVTAHSGRRTMATEARKAKVPDHLIEQAAGVVTPGWASVYAEVQEEDRWEVSRILQEEAALT